MLEVPGTWDDLDEATISTTRSRRIADTNGRRMLDIPPSLTPIIVPTWVREQLAEEESPLQPV